MADPYHVQVASWGPAGIARWRDGFGDDKILDLSGANLEKFDFRDANLNKANFRGANLREASFFCANAPHVDFEGACLHKADFSIGRFPSANFAGADLTKARFWHTNLMVASLKGADCTGAEFTRTYFERNEVAGARFKEARFQDCQFANLDLSEVIGLDETSNYGPCTIGIDTLYRSKGQIPDAFLRRCGVPNTLIAYAHSLIGAAIQFFSCFISYTEADDAFSKRLYNDLQGENVRCWRWREDAKWGRTLIKEVDEGIRLYDKLVVILSEQSLQSEPVIREIERAMQKEAREKKEVLFPIRVDDAIFSWKHELQADVLRKVIGDFTQWEHADAYQNSFKKLLECLRA